jgi:ABC-type cobalamin transport system permease subunit
MSAEANMREVWFVVEVYCFLSVIKGITYINSISTDPIRAAIGLGGALLVFLLSFWTYRGKRMAARLLATYIAFGVFTAAYVEFVLFHNVDVYMVYRLIVSAYFFIGAIKLWRIKELPTRFTDPPAGSPTHA